MSAAASRHGSSRGGRTLVSATAFVLPRAIITKKKNHHCSSSTAFIFRRHYQQQQQQQKQQQVRFQSRLALSDNSNAKQPQQDDDDFEPTWTYVPYDPKRSQQSRSSQQQQQRRRKFSTTSGGGWTAKPPKTIEIPDDQIDMSFSKSSGAGGQNVNKVNTRAELKLHVMGGKFIPHEVRERLKQNQSHRINKNGYLIIASQEYRTQVQNRKSCTEKLKRMILDSWERPKIRKQRKGISKAAKERNKEFKKRRRDKKTNRGRVDF